MFYSIKEQRSINQFLKLKLNMHMHKIGKNYLLLASWVLCCSKTQCVIQPFIACSVSMLEPLLAMHYPSIQTFNAFSFINVKSCMFTRVCVRTSTALNPNFVWLLHCRIGAVGVSGFIGCSLASLGTCDIAFRISSRSGKACTQINSDILQSVCGVCFCLLGLDHFRWLHDLYT